MAYVGLDNAGKTSIIKAITKRFGFEDEVFKLMPTRKVVRDAFRFLGIEFIRMDFGGQAQYRDEYLNYPHKYLSGMDLIFYVIDVQDYERYVKAIDYLDQILLFFKEEQEYPPICVLFHKFDPLLKKDKNLNKKTLPIKQALIRYSHDFDIFFFETTIFDIKSVMDAFSSGLSLLFEKLELVSKLFAELSKNYNAILIALFDVKGITIGEYYRPHLHLVEKVRIYDKYLEVQKRIMSENKSLLEFSDKFDNGDRYTGIIEVLKFDNLDFYLLFILEEDETNLQKTIEILDKIESAKPQMENIILQIIQ
ncbi:MAG: ADP-ribosylation factor-like protein [Candidatus Heimdallarchaeota archaeon]